jgi:hypothetical protein
MRAAADCGKGESGFRLRIARFTSPPLKVAESGFDVLDDSWLAWA